jgi:hypothetical protein
MAKPPLVFTFRAEKILRGDCCQRSVLAPPRENTCN